MTPHAAAMPKAAPTGALILFMTPNVGDERQLQAREARRKLSARSTG